MPSFDRAARTGHKVSGGGGGGVFGRVAFFRRFFTTAAMKTVMAMSKSDVDGSSAHNVSSDAQEGSEGDRSSEAILRGLRAAGRPLLLVAKELRLFTLSRRPQMCHRRVQRSGNLMSAAC